MTGPLADFPGAVGLSGLDVYPWPTEDGKHGGSPHMHLTCAECYVVVSGRGRLETLGGQGHQTLPLHPGDVVWFGPGTIHRAVNEDGLKVIVVMQNSGLPEAGDAVLTLPPEYLTPERYPEAVSLLDASGAPSDERARARRDLAIEGFNTLKQQWYDGDRAALTDFYRAATELVGPRLEQWRKTVTEGPLAAAEASLRQIGALETGDFGHLGTSGVRRIEKPRTQSLGMCGLLHAYDPIRRAAAREE
ncbi:cupin domain-containing protein [Streptomyces sp. NPDC003832]